MTTAGQVLAQKKLHDVCTISPDATVFEAIKCMAEHNLGALIVTQNDGLVGVITERDYARKVILHGKASKTTLVREIMSDAVIYVTPDTPTEECMALIINKYIRHLPVLSDEKLVGIISIGDVVKATLGDREFLIDELVHYITDSPMISQRQRQWAQIGDGSGNIQGSGQSQSPGAFRALS
jgi:CBS domain-containing protein